MHTRIALYRANDPSEVDDLITAAHDDLMPTLSQTEGFVSYGVAKDTGDPARFISVSQWRDLESATQGRNKVSDWLNDSGLAEKISDTDFDGIGEYSFLEDPNRVQST